MGLEINYEHDVHSAVAVAIEILDAEMIEAILRKCQDWLEPDHEKQARYQMLTAIAELIYECESRAA